MGLERDLCCADAGLQSAVREAREALLAQAPVEPRCSAVRNSTEFVLEFVQAGGHGAKKSGAELVSDACVDIWPKVWMT